MPSMATCEAFKSHLKRTIFELTRGNLDLSNSAKFPQFQAFYADFSKRIKNAEKREEPLDKEILKSDIDQIENLLIVLQDLMCETDKSSENYQNLLLKLPIDYANEYHYLIQWSAVYVILSHNTRKSKGHVDSLKTSHFVKQIEIETNCFYFELAKVCIFLFF